MTNDSELQILNVHTDCSETFEPLIQIRNLATTCNEKQTMKFVTLFCDRSQLIETSRGLGIGGFSGLITVRSPAYAPVLARSP